MDLEFRSLLESINFNDLDDMPGGDITVGNVTSSGTVQAEQLTSTDDATITDLLSAARGNFTAISTTADVLNLKGLSTIGSVSFSGTGSDDLTTGGTYTGTASSNYYIEIDSGGTPGEFKWSNDNGSTFEDTEVSITGFPQNLDKGVTITIDDGTQHDLSDNWTFTATPYTGTPVDIQNIARASQFKIDNKGEVTLTGSEDSPNIQVKQFTSSFTYTGDVSESDSSTFTGFDITTTIGGGDVHAGGGLNSRVLRATATGNMGTTGSTSKTGIIVIATGTADSNTALSLSASGATSNNAIRIAAGNVLLDADGLTLEFGEAQDATITFDGDSFNFTNTVTQDADYIFTGNDGGATVTTTWDVSENTWNFGDSLLTTTGTLGAGAATVTSLDAGSGTIQTTGVGNFGTMQLGTWASHADIAVLYNEDFAASNATDYALLHHFTGKTILNSVTGQPISFRVNNVERMQMSTLGVLAGSHTSGGTYQINNGIIFLGGSGAGYQATSAHDGNTVSPQNVFRRAKGTIGSQTVVVDGNRIGSFSFLGHDGTDINTAGAAFLVNVDGTVANNSVPMEFAIEVMKEGETTRTEAFKVRSSTDIELPNDNQSFIQGAGSDYAQFYDGDDQIFDISDATAGAGTPDFVFVLQDNAGASVFYIFNSDEISQFNVNSVGDMNLNGTIIQAGIIQTISGTKTLTDGAATGFVEIAIPSGDIVGGNLTYSIHVVDGTPDYQSHAGMVSYVGVNKAGTVTSDIEESYLPAAEAEVVTAGTLTDAYTITNGDGAPGKITLNCNANTSLAGATITLDYTLTLHSTNAITKL